MGARLPPGFGVPAGLGLREFGGPLAGLCAGLLKLGEKFGAKDGGWKEEGGKLKVWGTVDYQLEKDTTILEAISIAGGFTGAGSKTVIPAKALAKVSFRLVPNQNPEKIVELFRAWVAASRAFVYASSDESSE